MEAKLLGAVLGSSCNRPDYIGIGLDIQNSCDISFEPLMEAALDVVLGLSPTNEEVVDLLFQNLMGVFPSTIDRRSCRA